MLYGELMKELVWRDDPVLFKFERARWNSLVDEDNKLASIYKQYQLPTFKTMLDEDRYFCSLGPHLEKNIKMITYDDQTSLAVSTTPVLRVCTCHVIKKL